MPSAAIDALNYLRADLGPICRLADQLDAALAAGEDLLAQTADAAPLTAGDTNLQIAERHAVITAFARSIRALELAMTARLLQARARAIDVRNLHPRFAPIIGLFIGGTAPLADAAAGRGAGLGDISTTALVDSHDVLLFLISRGLAAPAASSLAGVTGLAVTDDYQLAGHIQLGPLMDMIAQFLETLDLAFDLYADPRTPGAGPAHAETSAT